MITPVNYAIRGGAILIWTNSHPSLTQAVRGAVVAFQVDHLDYATHGGWSVSVTANAQVVTDETERDWARIDGPVPWAPGIKEHLIRIPLTRVTGRWLGPRDREPAVHDPGTPALHNAAPIP